MTDNTRLRVGLPVYNGENYLEHTLRAILAQTYREFTLVVSDNASTDATPQIVKDLAVGDDRITYVRHPENLGAAPNYNAAYTASAPSEFFCWIAHDDVPHPDFFKKCVAALDDHPSAVVAYSGTQIIDPYGNEIGHEAARPALESPDAHVRLADAIDQGHGNHPVFGVMRRSALDQTRLHGSYTGSDRTLLAELAMLGPYVEVPETLFSIREHPDRSVRSRATRTVNAREAWFDTAREGRIVFPRWQRLNHYLMAVVKAPVDGTEKMRSVGTIGRWLTAGGNWKPLMLDVTTAARQLAVRVRR